MGIYKETAKREEPESYLDFESSLKKYIDGNPQRTEDSGGDRLVASTFAKEASRVENDRGSTQKVLIFGQVG